MMRNFLKIAAAVTFFLMLVMPISAKADDSQLFTVCNSQTSSSVVCRSRTKTNPVSHEIKVASDIVAIATGVAAIIFIILGGLTMVTSAGNAEAVANARKRITYAVVGLVIVALAWTMIAFVTDKLIQ